MNRDNKKCSNCGEVKSIDAYANKWKAGRGVNKHWAPKLFKAITKSYRNGETLEHNPYCKECCKNFGIRNTSLYTIAEQKTVIEWSKIECLELIKELYWIHLKDQKDPTTQGYIGIGVPGARPASSMRGLAHQFGISESDLVVTVLKKDIGKVIHSLELDYRPHDGIGMSYQKGGSVGNGAGCPGYCAEQILNYKNK